MPVDRHVSDGIGEEDFLPTITFDQDGHPDTESLALIADTLADKGIETGFAVPRQHKEAFLQHLRMCRACRTEIFEVLGILHEQASGEHVYPPPGFGFAVMGGIKTKLDDNDMA